MPCFTLSALPVYCLVLPHGPILKSAGYTELDRPTTIVADNRAEAARKVQEYDETVIRGAPNSRSESSSAASAASANSRDLRLPAGIISSIWNVGPTSSTPRGTLRCVERYRPSTRHIRRSDTSITSFGRFYSSDNSTLSQSS